MTIGPRERHRRPDCSRLPRRSVVEQGAYQDLTEVLDQMEPVDHRHRLGHAPAHAVGVQVAALTKSTSLSALSQRLAAHRGQKRALVVRTCHRRARHEPPHELGHPDLDEQRRDHLRNWLTRRMERLGYRVSLSPVPAA
jgi:hypothetical protein